MNREDIIKLANKAYGTDKENKPFHPSALLHLEIFANLVASAEREACAKVCDEYDVAEDVNSCDTAEGIAIAIRARGQA